MKGWFRSYSIFDNQEVMEKLILENRTDILEDILSHTELWQTSDYDTKITNDGVIRNSTVIRAVRSGSLEVLKLFDKYKLFNRKVHKKSWMKEAVDSNSLNTVRFIYKHAYHGDNNADALYHELYFTALANGNLEIFDWLRSKGLMTSIKFIFDTWDLEKFPIETLIEWIRNNAMKESDWSKAKGVKAHMDDKPA